VRGGRVLRPRCKSWGMARQRLGNSHPPATPPGRGLAGTEKTGKGELVRRRPTRSFRREGGGINVPRNRGVAGFEIRQAGDTLQAGQNPIGPTTTPNGRSEFTPKIAPSKWDDSDHQSCASREIVHGSSVASLGNMRKTRDRNLSRIAH
jgi:hypothetical protein